MLELLKTKPSILVSAEAAKFKPGLVLQLLIFAGVFLVSQMIAAIVPVGYLIVSQFENIITGKLNSSQLMGDRWMTLIALFCTVIVTLLVIIYCRFIERRSLYSMGFVKENWVKQYLSGMVIGFVMFGTCVLIAFLTGTLEYKGVVAGASGLMIFAFFAGFLLQGMSEEVTMRGYLMISLTTKKSILLAIIVNSVLFALMHLLNSGVTVLAVLNLILFGVFASVYTLKTNNIWGICAIHSVWNFVQGNVFGILVSGVNVADSVFSFVPTQTGKWINGGSFGLEGGLAVTVVLICSIILTVVMKRK